MSEDRIDHDPRAVHGALDMGALPDRFGYNLRRTNVAVQAHLSTALKVFDIRPKQYGILLAIGNNPGSNQGQVAQAVDIARTNFVQMLDALEKRGLVQRQPSTLDRRSFALYLTREGEKLVEHLQTADANHESRLRALIGEQDAQLLVNLLRKLRLAVLNDGNGKQMP